jgi:hypothetical protein
MGVNLGHSHKGKNTRLTVSEKGVLRRIFGHKMDEEIRYQRKLHNKELHNSYSSPNITNETKWRM